MALKRDETEQPAAEESPAAIKAREVFTKMDQAAEERQRKDFGKLKHATETMSFRVPTGERNRIRLAFARHGMTLADGLKTAVYEYLKSLEGKK
jgi:hypothetical protein